MILLAVCFLAVLFFILIFYALRQKGHVRAAFKGPFAAFEFEADDRKIDSNDDGGKPLMS